MVSDLIGRLPNSVWEHWRRMAKGAGRHLEKMSGGNPSALFLTVAGGQGRSVASERVDDQIPTRGAQIGLWRINFGRPSRRLQDDKEGRFSDLKELTK